MTKASQDHPIQNGSADAQLDEKLHGVLVQVIGDATLRPEEDVEALLRQRLRDAHIQISEENMLELVQLIPELVQRDDQNPGAH